MQEFLAARRFSLEVPLRCAISEPPSPPRIAAVVHIFYPDQAPEIASYLDNIPFPTDLFVSTDTHDKAASVEQAFRSWNKGSVGVTLVPNRGRDIAPKLVAHARVHDRYEFVLHIHSKASLHSEGLKHWRGYLLETLLGSPEIVRSAFALFAMMPRLGFLAPQHWEPIVKEIGWGGNFAAASDLARRIGFVLSPDKVLDFPSGSMFWARSAALRPLLRLGLTFDSFPPEDGQRDATVAHAIERLFFVAAEAAGYRWFHVARPEFFHDRHGILPVRSVEGLRSIVRAAAAGVPATDALVRALDRRSGGASAPAPADGAVRPGTAAAARIS